MQNFQNMQLLDQWLAWATARCIADAVCKLQA